MPPINTFSSCTHLNEVCFHLSYGHLHYTLNYHYQDVSTVLLHSLVFTSLFFFHFPDWQLYAKPVDFAMCSWWELQPVHLEELWREPMGKTSSTSANCRPVCGRLGNPEGLKPSTSVQRLKWPCPAKWQWGLCSSLKGTNASCSMCGVRIQN